jgi:hypothetical protein
MSPTEKLASELTVWSVLPLGEAVNQYEFHRVAREAARQLRVDAARIGTLESSLADMIDMNQSLLSGIAEYSKDTRILSTPSPRLIAARAAAGKEGTP